MQRANTNKLKTKQHDTAQRLNADFIAAAATNKLIKAHITTF